jgi:hypothetical protein
MRFGNREGKRLHTGTVAAPSERNSPLEAIAAIDLDGIGPG